MAARSTRSGRVFSPYGVIQADFDASDLVARALCADDQGLDHWDLEPLTPLPSPHASPSLSPEHALPGDVLRDAELPLAPLLPPAQSSQPAPASKPGRRPGNHAKRGKAARRAAKRAAAKQDAFKRSAKSSSKKHVARSATISAGVSVGDLPIAKGAFVGVRQPADAEVPSLEDLLGKGFACREWDGRSPELLVDNAGRVVGVLAGCPVDASWDGVAERASQAMAAAYGALAFTDRQVSHRRGKFASLARGISFGGGRKAPGKISNSARAQRELDKLCSNPDVCRIAGFGSSVLATYAPLAYKDMNAALSTLLERHRSLRLNFSNSTYPAVAFNFGPQAVCVGHTDAANDPCNWCHVTALGSYDPSLGGHLVLYDLKLAIRFPPGSSILIPSAIMRHGNTSVRPHETRMCVTQYCAGGLLRWVECGCRSLASLETEDPQGAAAYRAGLASRVQRCIRRFSTVESLPFDLAQAV